MDPRRFDSLTRSLAATRSRRGFLGSLAALGAGLLGARAANAQVTQAQCGNVVCRTNPGVCNPGCVCCVYGNGNSRCVPPGTCTGTVVSPTTTTTAAPTTTTTTTQAPTTTTTTPTTTTTAAPLLGLTAVCTSAEQCDQSGGTTLCENNGCGSDGGPLNCCRPLGDSCGAVCDCCFPNNCNDFICGPPIG